MQIEDFLKYEYKIGARGENGFADCWGLTRLARAKLFNKPFLPLFENAKIGSQKNISAAYRFQSSKMKQCEKKDGAIVAILKENLCIHVALVVKEFILEIKKEGQRARLVPFYKFMQMYKKPLFEVLFYD